MEQHYFENFKLLVNACAMQIKGILSLQIVLRSPSLVVQSPGVAREVDRLRRLRGGQTYNRSAANAFRKMSKNFFKIDSKRSNIKKLFCLSINNRVRVLFNI